MQAFSTFSRARLNCTRLNLRNYPKHKSTGWRLRGWSKPTQETTELPGHCSLGTGHLPVDSSERLELQARRGEGGEVGGGDLGRVLRPHLQEPYTWAPRSAGASGAGHQRGGEAFLSVNKFVLRNSTPKENFYRKKQDCV